MSREITKAVNEIIKQGTKIVSFKHRGQEFKNVLIGSFDAERLVDNAVNAIGDKKINRAMTKAGKDVLLYGISNNEARFILDWDVKEITDFSYLFPRHYKRTLWEKIVDFFSFAF
jgi:predicted transcriptional regulator